jgi:hypothetical protein
MKKLGMSVLSCLLAFSLAFADNGKPVKNLYQFSVDLTKVKDDKITVELIAPCHEQKRSNLLYA